MNSFFYLFKVRLASLDVLGAVSKKLGDIYNSIFTETAPFLAELMEGNYQQFIIFIFY